MHGVGKHRGFKYNSSSIIYGWGRHNASLINAPRYFDVMSASFTYLEHVLLLPLGV